MSNIADSIKHLAEPVGSLQFDPKNANKHSRNNIQAIADSYRHFKQMKPIVAMRDGTVIAGNGQLEAAIELGWDEIAVCWFDGTREEGMAFALADNRTAQLAEWDLDRLAETLAAVHDQFEPETLGFFDGDLAEIAKAAAPKKEAKEKEEHDEDKVVCCPRCGSMFVP